MAVNLAEMSRKELLKLRRDVDKALKSAEQREKQNALKAAEKAAAEFGFSLAELTPQSRKGGRTGKATAKYRNPSNPDQTWTGRGRKPQWIHDAMAAGMDISALEI